MWNKIKRHLWTPGFIKRVKHIYIPAIYMGVAYIWNKLHDKYEQKKYTDVYKNIKDIVN